MPHAPRAESPRFARLALTLGLAGVFFAIVYPWAIGWVLERLGTRATAATLLAIVALTWAAACRGRRGGSEPDSPRFAATSGSFAAGPGMGRSTLATLGVVATLACAALLDDRRFLRLLPAWIYLGMTIFCLASARSEESVIERGVRFIIPEAPEFIRSYCRVLTGLWAGFFLLTAAAIAFFAFAMPPERWRSLLSRDVWLAMAAVMVGEFLIRKSWFRYYFRNGPFERFWARLFPAEATARGRRSMEYIAAYHARIARESSSRGGEHHR